MKKYQIFNYYTNLFDFFPKKNLDFIVKTEILYQYGLKNNLRLNFNTEKQLLLSLGDVKLSVIDSSKLNSMYLYNPLSEKLLANMAYSKRKNSSADIKISHKVLIKKEYVRMRLLNSIYVMKFLFLKEANLLYNNFQLCTVLKKTDLHYNKRTEYWLAYKQRIFSKFARLPTYAKYSSWYIWLHGLVKHLKNKLFKRKNIIGFWLPLYNVIHSKSVTIPDLLLDQMQIAKTIIKINRYLKTNRWRRLRKKYGGSLSKTWKSISYYTRWNLGSPKFLRFRKMKKDIAKTSFIKAASFQKWWNYYKNNYRNKHTRKNLRRLRFFRYRHKNAILYNKWVQFLYKREIFWQCSVKRMYRARYVWRNQHLLFSLPKYNRFFFKRQIFYNFFLRRIKKRMSWAYKKKLLTFFVKSYLWKQQFAFSNLDKLKKRKIQTLKQNYANKKQKKIYKRKYVSRKKIRSSNKKN